MKKRAICAIGSSHVAAAKLGWDAIADEYPDFSFEFFGFPPGTSSEKAFRQHVKQEGQSAASQVKDDATPS